MGSVVVVTITMETQTASELCDSRTCETIHRPVSRLLQHQRQKDVDRLFFAMEHLDTVEEEGLTDEMPKLEVAGYNAER